MRICVCNLTYGEEYTHNVQLGLDSIKKYCELNQYDFKVETKLLDLDRHVYWNKILVIQKYLPHYDFVVWLDSDIMIIKPNVKLEDIIQKYMSNHDFLLADDPETINTGVWFCRNNKYVFDTLSRIYEQTQFNNTRLPEQFAFEHLLYIDDDLRKKTKRLNYIQSYLINATMYNLKKGSFLVHFMGIHKKEWLVQVMNDHYPYKKIDESEWNYYDRIRFLNKKYEINMRSMNIGVVVLLSGEEYKESVKYGTITKEKYCEKHNYTLIKCENILDKDRHPAWSKILLAKKELRNFDFVWILDADTMIFNLNIKLEDIILDHMYSKDILACRDVSGKINTGSIFLKNTDYVYGLLDRIYSEDRFKEKYWEQDAFNYLYESDNLLKQKCSILDTEKQVLFNCPVGLYRPDIFLVHFYGPSNIKWVEKAMRDLYKDKREDENTYMYLHRREWHDKTYGQK